MSFKLMNNIIVENEVVNYPIEFLNSLDISGIPPYNLWINFGSPTILIRNLNPPRLYNCTHLVIKRITVNVIKATILIRMFIGKIVLLPLSVSIFILI